MHVDIAFYSTIYGKSIAVANISICKVYSDNQTIFLQKTVTVDEKLKSQEIPENTVTNIKHQ